MTTDPRIPQDEDAINRPLVPDQQPDTSAEDNPVDETPADIDVGAALEALGSLDAVVAQQEAEEAAERVRQAALHADEEERREAERIAAEEHARWVAGYHLPRPAAVEVNRGRLTTLVPALLLMLGGAYLTLALTLPEDSVSALPAPTPALLMLLLTGGVALSLLTYWLASGRWARGALFSALSLGLGGGLLYALTLADVPALLRDAPGPLASVVLGLAALLSGVLARPVSMPMSVLGLAIIAGGGLVVALSAGLLGEVSQLLENLAVEYGGVVLIVGAVLLILPLLARLIPTRRRAADPDSG